MTLREAVELARKTFFDYEDLHLDKNTPEGDRKAKENLALGLKMEEALSAPDQLEMLEELERKLYWDDFGFGWDGEAWKVRFDNKDGFGVEDYFDDFRTAIIKGYELAKKTYPDKDWKY